MPDLTEMLLDALPSALHALGSVFTSPDMLRGYVVLAGVAGLSVFLSRHRKRRRG